MTPSEYYRLYRDYIEHPKAMAMLKGIEFKNKRVLDLCCGCGDISKFAVECEAASVHAVDVSEEITQGLANEKIRVFNATVRDFLFRRVECKHKGAYYGANYDVVVCRQAVNYWFSGYDVANLSKLLSPQGIFVFNTFTSRPSHIPTVKAGNFMGTNEVVQCIGDTVCHSQFCSGMKPHHTEFDYIAPEEFQRVLNLNFLHVVPTEYNEGKSAVWKAICPR